MNPIKPNSNFFPPNKTELNPHNSNAHNSFLSKNQHWTQSQARLLCQKYSTIPLDQNEIAQQILIGLWQALLSYNPTKDVPFQTFALQTTIRQNLSQLLRNQQKHRHISLDATLQTNNPSQPRTLADTLKANPPTPPQIPQKSSISSPTTTKPKPLNCSTKAMLTRKSENSWDSNQSRQYTTSSAKTKPSEKPCQSGLSTKTTKTTTESEKKCRKTQKSSFSPEQNCSFLLLMIWAFVVFFRFWMGVVKKAAGEESGGAASFSAWKTKIVRLHIN